MAGYISGGIAASAAVPPVCFQMLGASLSVTATPIVGGAAAGVCAVALPVIGALAGEEAVESVTQSILGDPNLTDILSSTLAEAVMEDPGQYPHISGIMHELAENIENDTWWTQGLSVEEIIVFLY